MSLVVPLKRFAMLLIKHTVISQIVLNNLNSMEMMGIKVTGMALVVLLNNMAMVLIKVKVPNNMTMLVINLLKVFSRIFVTSFDAWLIVPPYHILGCAYDCSIDDFILLFSSCYFLLCSSFLSDNWFWLFFFSLTFFLIQICSSYS